MVRLWHEIRVTLHRNGMLDSLLFMSDMVRFYGQSFKTRSVLNELEKRQRKRGSASKPEFQLEFIH